MKTLPQLPVPICREHSPYVLDGPGRWLVLSDCHIPYHHVGAIEAAIAAGVAAKVKGVLLNGDIFDFHQLSRYDIEPTAARYTEERAAGMGFLAYLGRRLPRARIIFKEGNHEERLKVYLIRKAPELFGLEALSIPSLFEFDRYGVEFVGDRRLIRLGRLNILHGHEYRPAMLSPVNPARGLFLRAKSVALCGHFHQTSEHHEPDITGKSLGTWSVGCSCSLYPEYMPLNRWNHGYALVEVAADGTFAVDNRRLVNP